MDSIFDEDADEVGGEIEAYCPSPRCKADTTHTIISMYEDEVRRVQCVVCGEVHAYRKPRGDSVEEPGGPEVTPKKSRSSKMTWEDAMSRVPESDLGNTRPYTVRDTYEQGELVHHPVFDIGIVTELLPDNKVEITFRDRPRVMAHNLGVTEAGPPPAGLVKATAGIATLLAEGIGDTIRYSLTADPVEEARAGRQLLEALGLRERKNVDLIACPSCGRAEVDVIDVAQRAMAAFGERQLPLQVAVMGCVVNGPGEAREADLGIAAGNKRGHLFVKGRNIAVVPEAEMVDALVEWAEFINEHGVEAAIAKADTALAEREAAKDRSALLSVQGDDANHAAEKIVEIRKLSGS